MIPQSYKRISYHTTFTMIIWYCYIASLHCDDNKVKMARKPEKKQKENPVRCTGEGKR